MNNEPNGTPDEIKMNILHSMDGYYISKEKGVYHVWVPGITHATCDSAYDDMSLAVSRCNYLHRSIGKNGIFNNIHNVK